MKAEQKRKPRAYKITDKTYGKAMKRAKKEKKSLATMIEDVVLCYSKGSDGYWFGDKPETEPVLINLNYNQ